MGYFVNWNYEIIKGCNVAPDLILEILLLLTAQKDSTIKFDLYEEAGLKEYWLIYPDLNLDDVILLDDNGKYRFIKKISCKTNGPGKYPEGMCY